jgi:hypothetical protein
MDSGDCVNRQVAVIPLGWRQAEAIPMLEISDIDLPQPTQMIWIMHITMMVFMTVIRHLLRLS